MIRLSATNEKLQVKLAGAITTSQLDCYATYIDGTTAAYGPGASAQAATNNTTAVDLVGSPSASTTRDIDHVSVFNSDTVSATVTLQWTNGTQTRILRKVALATGEMLVYTHGDGWTVMDVNGNRKQMVSSTLPSLTVSGNTALSGTLAVTGMATTPWVPTIGSYSAGDTTPSVLNVSRLAIANGSPTTITNFDDGVDGQILVLTFQDTNTTVNRTNCYLAGGANFTSTENDTLVLLKNGSTWREISRSANS